MPLEPYYYRPATPPREPSASPLSNHSRNTSGSSAWSRHGSPSQSVETRASTPSRSPLRQYGPTLLPKIRTQEQTLEAPSVGRTHRRAQSTSVQPSTQSSSSRPGYQRSTTSPPEYISILSPPVSTTSTVDTWHHSAAQSPAPYAINLSRPSVQQRSVSASRISSHSRNSSNSSSSTVIDDATLRRYGYPTYRNLPTYRTSSYAPSHQPGASTFVPPPITVPQRAPPVIPEEFQYHSDADPTLSLTEYLTRPNPAIHLCPELKFYSGNGKQSHFWWDIRNLRTWESFNLQTISLIPGGFPRLLQIPMRATALPEPQIPSHRLSPSSESALFDLCRDFYIPKVNAALKPCLGWSNYISMRAPSTGHTPEGPHFLSNYQADTATTFTGTPRARVVGLVKSYHRWNTGMRHEVGHKKVLYLAGLAHLQRVMRDHSCRYGFLITEIELVCVRLGTEPADEAPYFGFLELSPAIRTGATEGMTAGVALWYLNMLAKEDGLPGQMGWRVEVGPAAGMSRMKVLGEGRDEWIPGIQKGEMRAAKTVRGWVLPADPFHRGKEGGKVGAGGQGRKL